MHGFVLFFFQAEDGIRDLVRSRGLGDVYKRQVLEDVLDLVERLPAEVLRLQHLGLVPLHQLVDVLDAGVLQTVLGPDGELELVDALEPVSYTHLTLPTSDLV